MAQPNFFQYPPSLPMAEMLYLAGILRGQSTNVDDDIQAAWVIVGYGKSQLAFTAKGTKAGKPKQMSNKALAEALESAAKPTNGMAAGAIPWSLIISTLGPLLLKWLLSRTGG